jgi:hypothetical protein
VIVVADRLPATVQPGDAIDLTVHAVNDLHRPLLGARVTAELRWPGGRRSWAWQGDLPADACVEVGRVDATVPITVAGPLELMLRLEADGLDGQDKTVTNRDGAQIDPA